MEANKLDSVFSNFAIPYESTNYRPFTDAEDNDLRLVGQGFEAGSSMDCYVTPGGSLAMRPAFTNARLGGASGTILSGKRIEYTWLYETLPDTLGVVYTYMLASAITLSTSKYSMYYQQLTPTLGTLTAFTNLRSVNDGIALHRVGFSRGLAYIKTTVDKTIGEKLGTIIFDGTGGAIALGFRLWGLLGPTVPARIAGFTTKLTAEISATVTTIAVTSTTGFGTTGTIQIDTELISYTGTTATTFTGCTRKTQGTTAAVHRIYARVLKRNTWAAAAHKIDVNQGWLYAYTWKTVQGQESNRSDIESNPDLLPSDTLPFFDLRPKITVQGHADTTNVDKICIYRTTDGGGDFYFLEEITNTGAGDITYEDDSLASGAAGTTFEDPIPDTKIDTARTAPSLTSNSPPPAVNPPGIVGSSTPDLNISPIATFSSRLWYALNNIVYYSGDEEIKTGIPEESWPSGVAGNFFRFTDRIVSLQATSSALYALGTIYTYMITGTNKETFSARKIASHAGMWASAPDASVSFLDRVAFLTGDGRIMAITGDYLDLISEPLVEAPRANTRVQLHFYTSKNLQWLIVLDPVTGAGSTGTLQIYDWTRSTVERRDFWFAPWNVKLSAMFAFYSSTYSDYMLVGVVYGSVGTTKSSALVSADFASVGTGIVDSILVEAAWSTNTFGIAARIQPFKNPPGNHINTHAIPSLTTVLGFAKIDYFAGSAGNIGLTVFYDNSTFSGGTAATSRQIPPTRRAASTGYVTREWWFYQVGQDFGMTISSGDIANSTYLRLDRIAVGMLPGAGPDAPMGDQNGG